MKPKVIIKSMPIRNRGYFEWLYTGLQILEQEDKIETIHEGSSWDCFLRKHPRVYGKLNQYFPDLSQLIFPVDHFSMFGVVELAGKQARFAYDVTDSPFTYALAQLELCDVYFKTQCPVLFESEGYPLSNTIRIPYHPSVLTHQNRIRPAMSTGPITSTFDLKRNLKLLEHCRSIPASAKRLKIFASFGGDKGPPPWEFADSAPAPHNYHNERSIVTLYGEKIQHPNEKRAEVVRILRKWGKADVDGRIWSSKDPEVQGDALPWNHYLATVAESVFNINVSGFRRSLPFRFLDSFQVGCGIATDTIGTRWYRPFDKEIEVVEFGDLGYESKSNTHWEKIAENLETLYNSIELKDNRSDAIREMFATKWHPKRLAEYFIEECVNSLESN